MKLLKKLVVTLIFVFILGSLGAQTMPPPNGDGSSPEGGGHDPVTDGAPIGGGVFILLALGGVYGGYKVYQKKKKCLLD